MTRDANFSILKAFAILFVVLCHSGAPGFVNAFVFMFHVPVFFMCAGYFFKPESVNDDRAFIVRRIRGLYFPFLRWSIFFLIIHNILFYTGILNEQIGNPSGGVTHPYSWHTFGQRLWSIVFNMSGYDEFLAGTFWFFRALLLSSIAFLVLFKLYRKISYFKNDTYIGWGILVTAWLLGLWKVLDGLTVTGVAQGGYREIMGLFFISAGFLYKQYQEVIPKSWKMLLAYAVFLVVAAVYFPSHLGYRATFSEFISLPLPAIVGFLFFLQLSSYIGRANHFVKRALVYVGENTLYIFAFHFVAFKLVSVCKVLLYELPWEYVGAHPVVNYGSPWDGFFLLYTLVGIAVPLLCRYYYRILVREVEIDYDEYISLGISGVMAVVRFFYLLLRGIVLGIWEFICNFGRIIKEIVDASKPRDEE